mgnify:CR=1 FL=1|jgi:hypothetical protein
MQLPRKSVETGRNLHYTLCKPEFCNDIQDTQRRFLPTCARSLHAHTLLHRSQHLPKLLAIVYLTCVL